MAAERVKARKGFEFRMSKKVAELTQVVHMLFTRNHEREVEIQMTKDLYNKELDRLHEEYQKKIDRRDTKIKSLTEKSESAKSDEAMKAKIDQALLEHESRWIKKYDSKESQYLTERNANVALKEMLTKYELELSTLKSSSSDTSQTFSSQLASKESELDRLRRHSLALERKLANENTRFDELANTFHRTLSNQQTENKELRSTLDESQLNEVTLSKKLQQAEAEKKALKKELAKRTASELTSSRRTATIHTPPSQDNTTPPEVNEELESLRKLVQKYRLELSNREGNFNRMFTEKAPVHIDQHSSIKPLAALSIKAPVRERSFTQPQIPPLDPTLESDKPRMSIGAVPIRAESGLGNRRSLTLTGIRRNIPPPGGRQLLAQYNQQHNFKT